MAANHHFLIICFFGTALIWAFDFVQGQMKFKKVDVSGVIFTEDLLFQSFARSTLHCSTQCAQHGQCLTFTFAQRSSSTHGLCQGHSSAMSSDRPQTTISGKSKTFVLMEKKVAEKAAFTTDNCTSPHTLSGNSGTFTSPGYPGRYYNNLNCSYVITLNQSSPQRVSLSVEYNLEPHTYCSYDYLTIHDNDNRYCGSGRMEKTFGVSGNEWTLRLVTDASRTEERGFLVNYTVSDCIASPAESCDYQAQCGPPPDIHLAENMTSVDPLTYKCTSHAVLINGPADVKCQLNGTWSSPHFSCEECDSASNLQFYGNTGNITSPGYPDIYDTNLECHYIVTLEQDGLQVVTVHLEFNLEYIQESCHNCSCAYFKINNDKETICGIGSTDKVFSVPGKQWGLDFISNPADVGPRTKGFSVYYKTISGAAFQDKGGWNDCGPPPEVDMAAPWSTVLGQAGLILTYACLPSAVLINGSTQITCQSNGSWTQPSFTCIDCASASINFSGNSGMLSSPGYPGQYDGSMTCLYIVTLDQSGPQTVTVSVDYNLEDCSDRVYDYLEINGTGEMLCGSGKTAKTFRVLENFWTVLFFADYFASKEKGFFLYYNVTCIEATEPIKTCEIPTDCGPLPDVVMAMPLTNFSTSGKVMSYLCSARSVLINGPAQVQCLPNGTWTKPTFSCVDCNVAKVSTAGNEGVLSSPGYPEPYDNNLDCSYLVTLDQTGPQTVHISMELNLEYHPSCEFDYLEFNNDGERYCFQGSLNKTLSLATESWTCHFVSDQAITKAKGFLIHYRLHSQP